MSFQTKIEDNTAIISIGCTRLDAAVAPELKEIVADMLGKGVNKVIIDLEMVEFMDSSGLGSVIGSFKLTGQSGEFLLCNLQEPVQEIFKLTHMDKVFDIHATLEDGYKKLVA